MVKRENLSDQFFIDSAATSDEEVVCHSGIHKGTKDILFRRGIPFEERYARQLTLEDYDKFDYIVYMEDYNRKGILRIIGKDTENKVHRLLDFSPSPRDISDPWYHHNFGQTFDEIAYGCEHLLNHLKTHSLHNIKN